MEEKIKRFQEELDKLWVLNHIIDWWIKEKNWVLSVKIDKNLMNNNFIYIFYKNWTIKANVINIDKKEIIYDIDYEELKEVILEVLKFKEFLFLIQKWFLVEKYMWISDLESFEIINEGYAKDKNFVYSYSSYSYGWVFKKIEWLDSESFEIINEGYAKDKNFVYYSWEEIVYLYFDKNWFNYNYNYSY